jgi:hypothetical protein
MSVQVNNGPDGPETRLLLCTDQRTSADRPGMSQRCQSTKSLRSSPLRGSKSREAGIRSREASDSGVANSRIVDVQRMIKNNRIISNQATL